ncbi:TIGR01777 family oxidoreductase [Spirosoma jeollabukense]
MKPRKIVLAGGSGFIGQLLIDHWQNTPVDIVVFSRKSYASHDHVRYVVWDGETVGKWVHELDGADVLINLAGKSVDCRYTERNKQLIMRSRINSTNILGEAVRQVARPPKLWINSASATIYRHSLDRQMDETTGDIETDRSDHQFSVQVCKTWEQTFWTTDVPATVRKVVLRMAIVLGQEGGALPLLKRLIRFGLGGKMGRGDQFMSWLHEHDLSRMFDFIIQNDTIAGTYNASAPNPIRNREFMALLRQSLGIHVGLPAKEWMLTIGAFFLRTEPELILKSRNVVPQKLLDAGFTFDFPNAKDAIFALTSV